MTAADGTHRYESGAWRNDETPFAKEAHVRRRLGRFDPDGDARDRGRLLHLLGSINYRILEGNRVYLEVGGIVYKTLAGLYWRSVFTGVEHYLLRCQQISGGIWTEGSTPVGMVDLPITRTKEGWTAKGYSLMYMLNRD